jgi:hypothetical protein
MTHSLFCCLFRGLGHLQPCKNVRLGSKGRWGTSPPPVAPLEPGSKDRSSCTAGPFGLKPCEDAQQRLMYRQTVKPWMYRSSFSGPRHWSEVTGQLHAPAALPPGLEIGPPLCEALLMLLAMQVSIWPHGASREAWTQRLLPADRRILTGGLLKLTGRGLQTVSRWWIVFRQSRECLTPSQQEKEKLEDRNWDGGTVYSR